MRVEEKAEIGLSPAILDNVDSAVEDLRVLAIHDDNSEGASKIRTRKTTESSLDLSSVQFPSTGEASSTSQNLAPAPYAPPERHTSWLNYAAARRGLGYTTPSTPPSRVPSTRPESPLFTRPPTPLFTPEPPSPEPPSPEPPSPEPPSPESPVPESPVTKPIETRRTMAVDADLEWGGNPGEKLSSKAFLKKAEITMVGMGKKQEELVDSVELFYKSGSRVEKWHEGLTEEEKKGGWKKYKELLLAEFPATEVVAKSSAEYIKDLVALRLPMEGLDVRDPETNLWAHQKFANQLFELAKAGEIANTASDIVSVHKNLPELFHPLVKDDGAMVVGLSTKVYGAVKDRISGWGQSRMWMRMADGALVPGVANWEGTVRVKGLEMKTTVEVFDSGGQWDLLVGKPLLEKFKAVHDYAKGELVLKKGKEVRKVFNEGLGRAVERKEKSRMVAIVEKVGGEEEDARLKTKSKARNHGGVNVVSDTETPRNREVSIELVHEKEQIPTHKQSQEEKSGKEVEGMKEGTEEEPVREEWVEEEKGKGGRRERKRRTKRKEIKTHTVETEE
ncbi:hypothetical protein PQX77_015269 [Marasmius sp. AFHP31]|nr:hypothetical protein PQX77_015269 [Marasmius sp. AFHP31]